MVSGRSGLERGCFSSRRRGARNGLGKRHSVTCEHPKSSSWGPSPPLGPRGVSGMSCGVEGLQVRLRFGLEPQGCL